MESDLFNSAAICAGFAISEVTVSQNSMQYTGTLRGKLFENNNFVYYKIENDNTDSHLEMTFIQ